MTFKKQSTTFGNYARQGSLWAYNELNTLTDTQFKATPEGLKLIFKKKCYFCGKKTREVTVYLSPKKIFVCHLCKEYAERRAFRRK
ncbi:hypothetical protein RCG23_14520 [Neobacillus sp. PS3-34]|uniref:hypothetical protein n=1 Tax=Neobacillus sp. PS3-34 TaxID=3070678 RepID=UPI0027DEBCA5|nr:hypothetical protein [Neobacillus sp. PS3-34]WML46851.1 hypothetical protein RCG23_14520 [Neobacillus sp. PS3-34]